MNQKLRYLMFWIIIFGVVVLLWQAVQGKDANQAEAPRENTEPERSTKLLAILLTWGPVLLIVGLWIFFMRRFHIRGNKALSAGRAMGRKEGQAIIVLRQARTKFGTVDNLTCDRIEAADEDTLLRIADRILTAQSPSDLF